MFSQVRKHKISVFCNVKPNFFVYITFINVFQMQALTVVGLTADLLVGNYDSWAPR